MDDKCNVHVRDGVSSSFPIGTKWVSVPELQAKELGISKSAVWLLDDSGKVYRRFGVSEKSPCGDYWKQIPGNMDFLSGKLLVKVDMHKQTCLAETWPCYSSRMSSTLFCSIFFLLVLGEM